MVDRVKLGLQNDGSYRLRVSRAGYDAGNLALNSPQIAFDSNWPVGARVHQSGVINFSTGRDSFSRVVAWPTLPYTPVCFIQGGSATQSLTSFVDVLFDVRADGIYAKADNDSTRLMRYIALRVRTA